MKPASELADGLESYSTSGVSFGNLGFAMRSANCRRCRMRSICPSAAVKSEAA